MKLLRVLQVLLVSIISFNTLLAQTNYSGTVNLNINGYGAAKNIKTTITDIENSTVVFTDTLHAGSLDFYFQTTGIENIISEYKNTLISTNILGYADFNITAYTSSEPVIFDVYNLSGQKTLSIKSGGAALSVEPLYAVQHKTSFYINLTGQTNGVYFFRLICKDNSQYFAKVLKSGENIKGQSYDTKESQGTTWSHPLTNKMLGNENYSISYVQILTDTDIARITDSEINILINEGDNNIINHSLEMVTYPEYSSNLSGTITAGTENEAVEYVKVYIEATDDSEFNAETTTNNQGYYSFNIDLLPSNTKPYIEAEERHFLLSVSSYKIVPANETISLKNSTETFNLNVDTRYTISGSANAPVQLFGSDSKLLDQSEPIEGQYEVSFDTTTNIVYNLLLKSEKTGYVTRTREISLHFDHFYFDMELEMNSFSLGGILNPTNQDVIVIANPQSTQDTILNSNLTDEYITQIIQQATDSINYRIISSANGFIDMDTTFREGAGEKIFDITLEEENSFSLRGNLTPSNQNVIVIANPQSTQDTILNSNLTDEYITQIIQQDTDSIDYRIISSANGFIGIDTTFREGAGEKVFDITLEENKFSLRGNVSPSSIDMIVIANVEDTILNSNVSDAYLTQIMQQDTDSIDYRVIANADGFVGMDSTFREGPGERVFDITLEEEAAMQEVIVKTAVRIDGGDYVLGARVIYEYNNGEGMQRDTAYTDLASSLAIDTIYVKPELDLSTVNFTRLVHEGESANYHFIPDTTENLTLNEGINGPVQVEVNSYDQVIDVKIELKNEDGTPSVGAKARLDYAAGGLYAEGTSDATGFVNFLDAPADTEFKVTAGYEKAVDSTKIAYENFLYNTPVEITEEAKEQILYFELTNKHMKIPGQNTGTPADSIYVTGAKIQSHAQGAANVRNTMGLNDQFYINPSTYNNIDMVTIQQWADEVERDYYNNEREIIFVDKPFELESNENFVAFDYINNTDSVKLCGWNVSDGLNNTSQVSAFASNGDAVIKGGNITISGNEDGFKKEFAARTNDITNGSNDLATPSERTAIYFIVNARQKRYETITTSNKLVPTVNYVVENYE